MIRPSSLCMTASLVVAVGLATAMAQTEDTPPNLAPGETSHFGAPFLDSTQPLPLSDALATCLDSGAPCKFEATVTAACARRGCWFTVAAPEGEPQVRVRMQDYGFFVPLNSAGSRAIIEGTLARTTIDQETAQHYADDAAAATGEPALQVTGPQDGIEVTATAVELTAPAVL